MAGLLRDLSVIQTSKHPARAYARAASAIMSLDEPLEALVKSDGTLPKVAQIGTSSLRIAMDVLRTGTSDTAERLIAASPKQADVARSRQMRAHFLSRARALQILRDPTLHGPRLEDYHGDFQMHSTGSDGVHSIEALAAAALGREYRCLAITDHSHGLPIAGGMSMTAVAAQHREIDAINRRLAGGFRVLKGIEANILADGTLDLSAEDRQAFDLVVAAPHAGLRAPQDQTARMLAVVRLPAVHILGHPRGRQFGTRTGIVADWDAVFKEAATRQVAIEIDGDPARQDIDHVLAKRALKAGCLFALDSDAHSIDELPYADTALAHARLAGIPPSRVINCWTLDRLLDWAEARKRSKPRGRRTRARS